MSYCNFVARENSREKIARESCRCDIGLTLMTRETFVAGLLLRNLVVQQKLRVCHTLLQSLATSCATKVCCVISLMQLFVLRAVSLITLS